MLAIRRRLLFIGLLIFIMGGVVAYQAARNELGQGPVGTGLPGLSEPRAGEGEPELQVRRYYSDCGHYLPATLPAGLTVNWQPQAGADSSFLTGAGWQLKQEEDYLLVTQEVKGLCPACLPKRHLGFKDGLVAIYHGPAGSLGQLEKVTNLRCEALPSRWQEKIASGQAEFNTERELLQALDSLDEYR